MPDKANMSTKVVNILKISLHRPKVKAVLDDLSYNATKLWNTANYQRREIWKETGEIPKFEEQYHLMKDNKWYRSLQTQSAQIVLKSLDASYKAWYRLRKKDPSHRPPGFRSKYSKSTIPFKPTGFKILPNNTIRLSVLKDIKEKHGLKRFLYIKYEGDIRHEGKHKEVQLVPKGKNWYIHLITEVPEVEYRKHGQIASIDLGVKHPAVMTLESGESYIFKGGYYNSVKRYWDKENSKLKSLVNSAGHKTSNRLKGMWSRRKHQIKDIEHKLTHTIVDISDKSGVKKIVVGDLTDIRVKANYSKKSNQKIHSWTFKQITEQLKYKARLKGIKVESVSELDTSKTCSVCGVVNKNNRVYRGLYKCSNCGSIMNADVNGSINIGSKVSPKFSRSSGFVAKPVVPIIFRDGKWTQNLKS